MPLGDGVVLGVTSARRDDSFLGRPVAGANLGNDVSIDLAINHVEFVPALRHQRNITAKIDPTN